MINVINIFLYIGNRETIESNTNNFVVVMTNNSLILINEVQSIEIADKLQ